MKNKGKLKLFVVFALILILSFTAFAGIKYQYGENVTAYIKGFDDIHWGIDLQGGSSVVLTPADKATEEQVKEAEAIIKLRLSNLGLTDYRVTTDLSGKAISVVLPSVNINGATADEIVKDISATGKLVFVKGDKTDENGKPTGDVILTGDHIVSADPAYSQSGSGSVTYAVTITFDEEGTKLFAKATEDLAKNNGVITVWQDDTYVTGATVNVAITDGVVSLSGANFTSNSVSSLADKISSGALPYNMKASAVTETEALLGKGAKNAAVIGLAALLVVLCAVMVVLYRVPGVAASIGLIGQAAALLMVVTGFTGSAQGIVLTLPGVLGGALALCVGAAFNVVLSQRIAEELQMDKGLHVAVKTACSYANKTVINAGVMIMLAAIVVIAAFSPVANFFVVMLSPVMFFFKADANAALSSFAYMLFAGVTTGFIFSVFASRIMLKAMTTIKGMDQKSLYGGAKNAK